VVLKGGASSINVAATDHTNPNEAGLFMRTREYERFRYNDRQEKPCKKGCGKNDGHNTQDCGAHSGNADQGCGDQEGREP